MLFMLDVNYIFFLFCVAFCLAPLIINYVNTVKLLSFFIIILSLLFITLFTVFKNVFFSQEVFVFASSNFIQGSFLLPFSIEFVLNPLSYSFFFLVVLIGLCTNIYLLNYFKGEGAEYKFVFWLNAFILSMLILVLGNNFFTLFLGWELIGLSSFFLINFWSTRKNTFKSSFKAFSFNLASDIFLLSAFALFFNLAKTDNVDIFLYLVKYSLLNSQSYLFDLATVCLVLCASIKSVQLISHLWLPDSMEAPVPASSLIHSATLVSAGIYLLCKFNILVVFSPYFILILFWGSLTALYGGFVSASQTDMKKLLAYSTMSHCGFLWVFSCLGNFYILVLYLFLHGIFKAATFYCAGSFIRYFGTQDTRWMGQGLKYFPVDTLLLLFCSANLAGFPFLFGTFYKTFMFKVLIAQNISFLVFINLLVAALAGVLYFFRLSFYLINDYYKQVKGIAPQYIQKSIYTLKNSSFFPPNHLMAVCGLILGSCFTIFGLILLTNILFNLLPMFTLNNVFDITLLRFSNLYFTYYYYFYFCYWVFIFVICFTFLKQKTLLEVAQINLFFLTSTLFSYI